MNDEKCRVVYTIFEYDPLLDSTNMTMDDWIHVAQDIKVPIYFGFLYYRANCEARVLENYHVFNKCIF